MTKSMVFITDWLKKQNAETQTNGFVFGLSGGVDSAVVAGLSKLASPDKTLGIIMPCKSDPQDAVDAQAVADLLQLKTITVDLSDDYSFLAEKLSSSVLLEPSKVTLANIKPRLRMMVLYFYANLYNRLVVGTGNRDERYVGYFTKWGDGGADIMPIAHLSKAEVRKMAQELKIPKHIIEKPPSAGLWLNQTDEQEMGFSYQVLDQYLKGEQIPDKARKRIEHLHRTSRHKLSLPPIIEEEH